jgi:hypothetical protein
LNLDLTLVNRPNVRWTVLADDHATGSDHEVIEWEVGVDRQEQADQERVVGWNLVAMMEEDAEEAENVRKQLVKERTQLDGQCTEGEVEKETACCQEGMSSVLDAMAKTIRICARSKSGWNAASNIDEGRLGGK